MRAVFYFGVGFITAVAAEFNQGDCISILGVSEYLGEGVDPLELENRPPYFGAQTQFVIVRHPLKYLTL